MEKCIEKEINLAQGFEIICTSLVQIKAGAVECIENKIYQRRVGEWNEKSIIEAIIGRLLSLWIGPSAWQRRIQWLTVNE